MHKKIMLFIPFLALAGAEMMVKDLAIGLYELGCEVVVVSLYKRESPLVDELLEKNIRIVYLEKKRGLDVTLFRRISKLIRNEKPDVVHTHLNVVKYVIPCAVFNHVKGRVHTVHNIAEKEQGKGDRIITRFYAKYCNLKLVAISPIIRTSIVDEYRISGDTVPMIFNGRNLDEFQTKKKYSEKEYIEFLHVGRFSDQKNHIMLINAFADALKQNPKLRLVLVGDGPLLGEVKEKVLLLGIGENVEFLGLRTDVNNLMNNADVFLLPSKYEGMPISLIEAMASGLPIIATNVGGVSDMINERSGLLIQVDQQELTRAMLLFAESKQRREDLGKNAKIDSVRFSHIHMAEEYLRLYLE